MKHLLLSLTILLSLNSFAQINITQSDMPNSGDTIRYSVTNDINDYTITGASYTWDYSSLTSNSQGLYEYKSALAINPVYVIPFGFFGFGLKISDGLSLGPISLNNIYNFFNKSASKYTIEGYGAEVSGVPLPSTYSDPDEFYQFPLNYGDTDTSTFDVKITIPTLGYIKMKGTRINIAEGWGTIITPYGTFNALKIQTIVDEIDSISTTLIPLSFGIPRKTVTYKWLCNTEKIPVLEVTGTMVGTTFTPNQIRYRDIFRESAIPFRPTANLEATLTTCTIADTVTINDRTTPPVGSTTYSWTITPNTFNYVSGTSNTSRNPKVNFTATGLYTVQLNATIPPVGPAGAYVSDDTTAANYILVRDFGVGIPSVNNVNTIQVYPNPVDQYIIMESFETISNVNIYTSNGQLIENNIPLNSKFLNVSLLETGTYFIEIVNKDKSIALHKFIKN